MSLEEKSIFRNNNYHFEENKGGNFNITEMYTVPMYCVSRRGCNSCTSNHLICAITREMAWKYEEYNIAYSFLTVVAFTVLLNQCKTGMLFVFWEVF